MQLLSKRFILVPLLALLALVGCGTQHRQQATPKFVCHHKVPAQIGECVRQEQELTHRLIRPVLAPHLQAGLPSQCVDISVWQGVPNFFAARNAGLKCVIIQTNDGYGRNSLFYRQTAAARAAGIPFGFYTFLEGYILGSTQAHISLEMGSGQGGTLGYWGDAEVSGSYEHACAYVNTIKASGNKIAGVYASPGNWFAGNCGGYDWPAEWGGGKAYPLSGYYYSQTVLRQWCGTCHFPGFYEGEVDRDESLGLLSLVERPVPPHHESYAHKQERLYREYRLRNQRRSFLLQHNCRSRPLRPRPGRYRHACLAVKHNGDVGNGIINKLHREGVR